MSFSSTGNFLSFGNGNEDESRGYFKGEGEMKCLAVLRWHRGSSWSGRSAYKSRITSRGDKVSILSKQSIEFSGRDCVLNFSGATFEIVKFHSFIPILTTYE